jgi:hypothetical protein
LVTASNRVRTAAIGNHAVEVEGNQPLHAAFPAGSR